MNTDPLAALGFTENETKIYVGILQKGRVSPANLAKTTGLNRTTVYSVAKVLLKKGIIAEDLAGPTAYLVARPPQDLRELVAQEEREIAEKKRNVESAIEQLDQLAQEAGVNIPKVVFIAEHELDRYLYRQTPTWVASLSSRDGVWWGFQDPSLVATYQEWIDWYWKKYGKEPNLSLNLLTSQGQVEDTMRTKGYDKRKVKFWSKAQDFTSTTWVVGDYVIMIYTRKSPHYLVEIHDAAMAQNMRELFKGIWASV